jgi:hypothetical protein
MRTMSGFEASMEGPREAFRDPIYERTRRRCYCRVKTPGILPPVNQMPPGPGAGEAPVLSTFNWIGDGSAPGTMEKITSPSPKIGATLSLDVVNALRRTKLSAVT